MINTNKIGISLIGIHKELGGNYVYAFNLINDLKNLEKKLKLVIFIDNKNLLNSIKKLVPKSEVVYTTPLKLNFILKSIFFLQQILDISLFLNFFVRNYRILDKSNCRAIFFPYWHISSCLINTLSISSIHDCAPVEKSNPANMSWVEKIKLHFLIKKIIKKSKFILVDSLYGKKLLQRHYNRKKNVLIHSFKPSFQFIDILKKIKEKNIKTKFKIKKDYMLLPGRWGSYKNTQRVIKAIYFLKKNKKKIPNLILTGIEQQKIAIAKEYIKQFKLTRHIHVLGFVSVEKLVSLYKNAKALIFPTLLGPTSIPIYEAFSAGTPVITSKLSGYPSLVKNAAILVNPYQIKSIANSIDKIFNNKFLQKKLSLLSYKRYTELSRIHDNKKTLDKILSIALD
jgi:glycosyltransferase involved in cell wall biosynthesis